jgi:membrane protein implicated in regulation of membrane protease activity
MQDYLIWVIAGFALVIIELMTGSFYLLVFGMGAFAGALAAFFGAPFLVQVLAAGLVAIAGGGWVHRWHKSHNRNPESANAIDIGQPVTFERWLSKSARVARIRYRGTDWEARVQPSAAEPEAGSTLYIRAQEGSTWVVAVDHPSALTP